MKDWLQSLNLAERIVKYRRLDQQDETQEILPERLIVRLGALTLLLFALWAGLFEIDIAAQAPGEVVPSGQIKKLQHLEGGIVNDIFVKEGQHVIKDQPIIEMLNTSSLADKHELESRIGALQIKIIRLESQQARKKSLDFPFELKEKYGDQVNAARALFAAQMERFFTANKTQEFRISQRESELEEIQSRTTHLSEQLKLLTEQIRINKKLLDQGLSNEYEHLELLKSQNTIVGQLAEAKSTMAKAETAIKQERMGLSSIAVADEEEMRKDLDESRKSLNEFQERMRKFTDSQDRTIIRSPSDGVVLTLFVVTKGGVVPPGGTVMTLVPANDKLVIEAKLNVPDIGFVKIGGGVKLNVNASGGQSYQPITGRVIHISPDTITEQNKEPYYLVRIAPDKDHFGEKDRVYRLIPGVRVMVAVLIGSRSVLEYVLSPFISGMSRALTEP